MLDDEEIEAIANRVADLIENHARDKTAVRLVDAQTVAQTLGVDREWVYAHANRLGAIRLGGTRGRLRFDLKHVQQTLATPTPRGKPEARTPAHAPARRWSRHRVNLLPYEP